jgi:AcrR family transcriptional regulator
MYVRQLTEVNVSAVTRARNPRGQGEQLRTDLLDAALRLLREVGDPEDVSIRAVAKAAGVSPTAAYRHFTDRGDLLVAACGRCFDVFSALLLEAVDGVEDPFEALRRAGRAYLSYAEADPGIYRVLFSNPLHLDTDPTDEDTPGSTAFEVLVGMVQACLDAGAPARGPGGSTDPDATYLAVQIWTWLHGLVDLRITHPAMPWPDPDVFLADVQRAVGLVPPRGGDAAGGRMGR